jgi:hypothetical protein
MGVDDHPAIIRNGGAIVSQANLVHSIVAGL